MTKVEICGGASHTAKTIINLCVLGCPLRPYIKEQGGGWPAPRARPQLGFLLGILFLVGFQQGKRGGRKERKRGRRKRGLRPLSNSDQRGGAGLLPFGLSPLFPYGPIRPIYSPANSHNSPVLRKIPESLGTFPNSEYSRPIYRSLRLDHFETPRHVPNLIRDSELLRYIKTHKLII